MIERGREACQEMLENCEFDDRIKELIIEGCFDEAVIDRARAILEEVQLGK